MHQVLLIIDDRKDYQTCLRFFDETHWKATLSDNGVEGQRLLQEQRYDLVVASLTIPAVPVMNLFAQQCARGQQDDFGWLFHQIQVHLAIQNGVGLRPLSMNH